jgi:hypothetical protein
MEPPGQSPGQAVIGARARPPGPPLDPERRRWRRRGPCRSYHARSEGLSVQLRPLDGRCVLVTGGSGFLGSRVVEGLCQDSALVLSVHVPRPRQRPPAACRAVEHDIRSDGQAGLVAGFAPHIVVHLAAQYSGLCVMNSVSTFTIR